MAQRLLRASVLTTLAIGLLLGGGPAGTDFAHANPNNPSVGLLGSGPSEASDNFELRSTIVFTSTRSDPTAATTAELGRALELYLMNPDGTDVRRLTNNSAGETFGVLSPDGKKIVFDSNRDLIAGEPLNTSDLFVMNADGTEQTKLTRGSSATWSPDSKKIAFHASKSGTGLPVRTDPGAPYPDSDIFVMNVDDCLGNADACRAKQAQPGVLPDFMKNVTNNGAATIDEDADWLPNGQTIAFTRHVGEASDHHNANAEIYLVNAAGTGLTRLTNNNEEERAPDWSPDGQHIAYICRIGAPPSGGTVPTFEICVMNVDGTGVQRLTNNDVPDAGNSWSPTGEKIVFGRPVPGPGPQALRRELFMMNADGTGQTQLTDTPGINIDPSWGTLRVRVQ